MSSVHTTNTAPRKGRPAAPPPEPSDAVKRVREALGRTQEQFALDLSCSVSAVRRYEQQRALPGVAALREKLAALAKRAGVKIEATST
jgi:DNA-binding transcriptional regulator YiaG